MLESISLIEPLMPSVENRQLVNLASELIEAAAGLNQSVHPVLRKELGTLVVMGVNIDTISKINSKIN